MEIKISGHEVEEAILNFVKKKYGHSFKISEHDPCMTLESSERIWVYRKHKNGKVKTNPEHGYKLVDHDKSTWKRTFTTIGECDEISFYVKEVSGE
ncbi:hypothetical protein [uncultured Maribacter sp.]|uniref:hypothetical protein n=1 Tax=uncultured Maribacter sp. TaxID=431308 RepID=UPI0030EE43C7